MAVVVGADEQPRAVRRDDRARDGDLAAPGRRPLPPDSNPGRRAWATIAGEAKVLIFIAFLLYRQPPRDPHEASRRLDAVLSGPLSFRRQKPGLRCCNDGAQWPKGR